MGAALGEGFLKKTLGLVKNAGNEIISNIKIGGSIAKTAEGNVVRAATDLENAGNVLSTYTKGIGEKEFRDSFQDIVGSSLDDVYSKYGGKAAEEGKKLNLEDQINFINSKHDEVMKYSQGYAGAKSNSVADASSNLSDVNKNIGGGSILGDIKNTALNYYGLKDLGENVGRDKVLKTAASRYGTTAAGVWGVGVIADGINGGYGD